MGWAGWAEKSPQKNFALRATTNHRAQGAHTGFGWVMGSIPRSAWVLGGFGLVIPRVQVYGRATGCTFLEIPVSGVDTTTRLLNHRTAVSAH